jgi:hypothetical protein
MRGIWKNLAVGAISVVGLTGLIGCGQSGTSGGPGATQQTTNKPIIGESDNAFRLSTPSLSTSVKQGERKDVTIGISRGNNFDQDVNLKFSDLPQGVTIDPASPMLKHDAKDVQVVIAAAPDAAVGDFTIHVDGHPATGPDATSDLKLSVAKK